MDTFFARLPEFAQNNIVLVAIFVVLVVMLVAHEFNRLTRKYKAVSPGQLTQLMNRENALVVDVSAIADYQAGHIIGARHVAMSQFDPENKDLAKVKDLPVAVVCKTGQTATGACERLVKAGFSKVYWLEGGMQAWVGADMPVTRGAK
jgi:rhodanese-related sulfurtransferase